MATLIPALGRCTARMAPGKRRLAERRGQKLEGDDPLWFDVPIGPNQTQPDLVVLHPRRTALTVERKHIPMGQYQAVLIDERHDFAPEWLKLVTQMLDPTTNSLLVLYDDAQSIDDRATKKNFSFKSVGVQAQGRTTILKINDLNTRQILQIANLITGGLLTQEEKDDAGIPLIKPISCGRDGAEPLIINFPTLPEQAAKIAELLNDAHQEGYAWGDMAVLCTDWKTMDLCASALDRRKLPHRVCKKSGDYQPGADAIQVMTMKVSKGLDFPVVALIGMQHISAPGEDEK